MYQILACTIFRFSELENVFFAQNSKAGKFMHSVAPREFIEKYAACNKRFFNHRDSLGVPGAEHSRKQCAAVDIDFVVSVSDWAVTRKPIVKTKCYLIIQTHKNIILRFRSQFSRRLARSMAAHDISRRSGVSSLKTLARPRYLRLVELFFSLEFIAML